ncbi:hypothetical protein [Halopiger thermotolerans]
MEREDITFSARESCSDKLITTIEEIVKQIETDGVSTDPNDASAYWLLDRLTESGDIVEQFISNWETHDLSENPNGGNHRLYYLSELYDKYGEKPISEKVREVGLLEKFREEQLRTGRLRVDGESHHGLAFRGLIAVAPDADITRDAISNIVRRYESDHSSIDDRIMAESALGLLEHDYRTYSSIVDAVTERVASKVRENIKEDGGEKYLMSTDILLLAKNPTHTNPDIQTAASLLFSHWMESDHTHFEPATGSEVGIALLAAGHGPSQTAYHADWQTKLREQRHKRHLPKFLSTQPATAVKNRQTTIKQQIQRMIEDTTESLYISTRGIGMFHHDILDLLDEYPELDFRVLTNRQRAGGDRKRFKRAAMDELAERTGTGVKQSELLHTRMMISDEKRLLVSNADIIRDQLHDSFNAGLYTEDPESVKKAVTMFNNAWESAEYMDPSK